MMHSPRRVRVLGAALLVAVFAAGVLSGRVWPRPSQPMSITITTTDAMPAELERLGLTAEQRARLGPVLVRGRDRVARIMVEFDPRFRAAADSTDAEIRSLLNSSQRAAFDSARAENPPFTRRIIQKPE